MNITNGWVQHPTLENLSPDAAIRQFCAARVEEPEPEPEPEPQAEGWPWASIGFSSDAPQPASSEVEELVDTFFNVEYSERENDEVVSDHHHLQEDPSLMIDDPYGDPNATTDGVDQGLELVHLLLACAEAVGCRDAHLAHSILTQIWPRANPWGDSLQRVSQCFAMGLKSRLSLIKNLNPNGTFSTRAVDDVSLITRGEKSEAFALLHQTTPYIAFGFMAANEAISEAASGKESLHIVDLGMEHVLQWPSLIKTLSSRPEGPPRSVRITGIVGSDQNTKDLETNMRRLYEEAFDLGIICFEHDLVKEQVSPSTLENLELREDEVLVVNSVMQLHKHVKESRGSLKAILQSIKKLRPAVVTVVEQDANHNGPFFLGRFLESLHYYSAIFDSLDACLPRNSSERMKIERMHLGEEIWNVVACEGCDRVERHERADQWRRQLGRGGFQVVGMKCLNEVREMVCGYGCDGYTVGSEKGCLQLGWKGRPIMLASAWHLNNSS